MKKRFYYFILVALSLTLVLILGACTAAPTPTPTPTLTPTPTPTPTPTSTPTPTPTSTPTPTPTLTPEYTIDIRSNPGLGDYLVDGNGMTLYYFTQDAENKSNASDSVIANWPVFYAADINVPPSLNAADFGTITRDNGDMQTTFKKWPLYYFAQDMAAGDVKGQGVNNVWFVVNPNNFMPPK